MESIDILTGQHVTIKYQPATILARMGALLLDYFFLIVYLLTVSITLFEIIDLFQYFPDWLSYTLLAIAYLLAFGYHFIFESILGGRTPGKMVAKIRVTNIDGSIPGLGAYFLRWILMPIDMLFSGGGVGAILILFSRYHQRLGDMAAGTIVVKTNPYLNLDLDETYYEFTDDYEPTFINVDRLSEGQIAFITNLLVEPKNKIATENSIQELADKVKVLLNTETDLESCKFLETIVRDYNYYASLGI